MANPPPANNVLDSIFKSSGKQSGVTLQPEPRQLSPIASVPTTSKDPVIGSSSKESGVNLKPSSPTTSEDSIPSILTLNVGGRHFRTRKSTLEEAHYFNRYLDGSFTWEKEEDGSYFVDSDPDTFEHVLRYLRHPSIYPLFWTRANGFDYNMYIRLRDAAEYFQVAKLEEWIKAKEYLKAVTVQVDWPNVRRLDNSGIPGIASASGDGDIFQKVVPRTEKVYVCPRGIVVHRGDPLRCGRACEKARGNEDSYEEETYMELATTHKRWIVHEEVCLERM